MKPIIVPTILVPTFALFEKQVKDIQDVCDYAQIDIMDGVFVTNRSFAEIERINDLHSALRWELHLMVAHPVAEMKKWSTVKNVFRAIFPIEAEDSPEACIDSARSLGWEVGIMLKPQTPLSAIEPFLKKLEVVLFMTVEPGRQGNPFLPAVGEKIKSFTALPNRPLCAVDGGVNAQTIPLLKSWGVEILNVGSALMKAADIKETYVNLQKILNN